LKKYDHNRGSTKPFLFCLLCRASALKVYLLRKLSQNNKHLQQHTAASPGFRPSSKISICPIREQLSSENTCPTPIFACPEQSGKRFCQALPRGYFVVYIYTVFILPCGMYNSNSMELQADFQFNAQMSDFRANSNA
jgi:hypothetical protein